MGKKGLTRLVFLIVFLIPVVWYLFLQLFGSNSFSLSNVETIPLDCKQYDEITILSRKDSLSLVETNYMNRVIYGADKRSATLINSSQEYFDCINQSEADLVLVNKKGLWGQYSLNREDVDRLLTELDILTLQESYGKGTSR